MLFILLCVNRHTAAMKQYTIQNCHSLLNNGRFEIYFKFEQNYIGVIFFFSYQEPNDLIIF